MSERPKNLDGSIAKLEKWKLDKLEGLFATKALAALAAVKRGLPCGRVRHSHTASPVTKDRSSSRSTR